MFCGMLLRKYSREERVWTDLFLLNNFWKFVRQHNRAVQNISAAYNDEGNVVFDRNDVSSQVIKTWSKVFSGQTSPVFKDKDLAPLPKMKLDHPLLEGLPYKPPDKYESYLCRPFTPDSLKIILKKLKDQKSPGYDNIPSEVLKYSGEMLQQYLLAFYNKIWKTGVVPTILNTVKCILVHKSSDSLQMLNYRPIAIPNCLLWPIAMRLADEMSDIAEKDGILGTNLVCQFHFSRRRINGKV